MVGPSGGTAKVSPVNRAQRDRHVDIEIDPLAHNILKPIPLAWAAFKFSTSHPPTCWGSSMRMNLILAPSRTILLSRSTLSLQKGKMDRARSHPPDCRSGPNGWVTQRRALAGVWLAYAL